MGILGAIYAGVTSIPLAIVLLMISGFLNAPSAIGRRLILQRYTEREVRGRVASAYFVSRDVVFLVGMALAGLADVLDVRWMMFAASMIILLGGVLAAVLPGLRQPAAQWRRAVSLLRSVPAAPGLEVGRAALMSDLDRYAARMPAMAELSEEERKGLLKDMTYVEAPAGTVVLRHGEVSDAAYLILEGKAVAGREEDGRDRVLEVLRAGDFFGEIAALTNVPRTANVVIEEDATLLQVPAATLREMAGYPALNRAFVTKMTERMIRMNMIDLPRVSTLDQQAMRELRRPDPQPQAAAASA
jgi:CRP-like cAMP-binding protein